MTETFELPAGQPVLLYQVRWENRHPALRWVAYFGNGGGVAGTWGPAMQGPLVKKTHSADAGMPVDGVAVRAAWLPQLSRIAVEAEQTGCGVGCPRCKRSQPA